MRLMMRSMLILTMAIFLMVGCRTTDSARLPFDPLCRHKVIYAAAILVEVFDTTIALRKIDGSDHVQTRVKINGEWYWIDVKDGVLYFVDEDKDFKITSYMLPSEYMIWYSKFIVDHKGVKK